MQTQFCNFLARTILRTHFGKKIENLFQIISHNYVLYVVMT